MSPPSLIASAARGDAARAAEDKDRQLCRPRRRRVRRPPLGTVLQLRRSTDDAEVKRTVEKCDAPGQRRVECTNDHCKWA